MTADDIKDLLGLVPLQGEGGWFVETYRATETFAPRLQGMMPSDVRSLSTAIYYLLTPGTFSALHRLRSDEVFHFYLGDPVEMLQLEPSGEGRVWLLGTDLSSGMRPQVMVPHGVWQGTRLLPGGALSLLGCTTAPGFDRADFELGDRETLVARYPAHRARILALTR